MGGTNTIPWKISSSNSSSSSSSSSSSGAYWNPVVAMETGGTLQGVVGEGGRTREVGAETEQQTWHHE